MKHARVYQCLIISPGDVVEERDAVEKVIQTWNTNMGEQLGGRIDPKRWEVDAVPELGDEPQAIINRQILKDCDLAVAVFWTRLGSPTARHPSGSAEEIEVMRARGAPVLVYFSDKVAAPSAMRPDQLAALAAYRNKLQTEGLLGAFATIDELSHKLLLALNKVMADLVARETPRTGGAQIGTQTAPIPDVRIQIDLIDLIETRGPTRSAIAAGPRKEFVRFEVQNFSPLPVFFTGISLETTSDGRWAMIAEDSMGRRVAAKTKIDTGDSIDVLLTASAVRQILAGSAPGAVVAHDAIGRRYFAPDGALAAVLAQAERVK